VTTVARSIIPPASHPSRLVGRDARPASTPPNPEAADFRDVTIRDTLSARRLKGSECAPRSTEIRAQNGRVGPGQRTPASWHKRCSVSEP